MTENEIWEEKYDDSVYYLNVEKNSYKVSIISVLSIILGILACIFGVIVFLSPGIGFQLEVTYNNYGPGIIFYNKFLVAGFVFALLGGLMSIGSLVTGIIGLVKGARKVWPGQKMVSIFGIISGSISLNVVAGSAWFLIGAVGMELLFYWIEHTFQ